MDQFIMTFFKSFMVASWYNGFDDYLETFKKHLIKNKRFNCHLCNCCVHNVEAQFFAMIIIIACGDWGTSPRYGWIEPSENEEAIKFIDKLQSYIRGS